MHLAMRGNGLFGRLDDKPWLGRSAPAFKMIAHAVGELNQYVSLGDAAGSLAAITMAGCLLGTILRRDSDITTHAERLRWALHVRLRPPSGRLLTDTFEGINKIGATPTWCLWSAAVTCIAWMGLYRLIDVAGYRGWTRFVRPAGANPLVAYFLHPIIVGMIVVAGLASRLLWYQISSNPYVVVAGSLGMAVLVCTVTGLLGRLGLLTRL